MTIKGSNFDVSFTEIKAAGAPEGYIAFLTAGRPPQFRYDYITRTGTIVKDSRRARLLRKIHRMKFD